MAKYLSEDLEILAEELEKYAGATIAVTGATGLIGSLILKAIVVYNQKHDNYIHGVGFARKPEKVASLFNETAGIDFIYQDISTPIDTFVCDYIIHTANSTNSKTFITNPVEVMDSIYLGSREVLEFARRTGIKGMVYLSSMEVFGQVENEERLSEKDLGYIDIQNVRSCYSEGKRIAECLCKCYAQEYGVPVKVARLAQTFGAGVLPGENRVFAQFARSALNGENIILHTTGESIGNYVYTRDAVKAILLLLQKGENGEAYTVVNETTTMQIRDMAEMVASNFSGGRSQVIFDIPEGNAFGYAPATRMHLSGQKLRKLGWQAEVDLKEMYQRMILDLQ